MRRVTLLFLSVFIFSGFSLNKTESLDEILGKIPVQSGGRVKPFESFAKEAALSVIGKASLPGQSAASLVWDWIARPEEWNIKSFLPVKYRPLKEELALMVIGDKISPELILGHPPFQVKVKESLEKEAKKIPLTPLEKKRIELYDRARLFQAVAEGSMPGFMPHPGDPRIGWVPLQGLASPEGRKILETQYAPAQLWKVETALRGLVAAFREKGKDRLEPAREFSLALQQLLESRQIELDQGKIRAELLYNQFRPFQWAWMLYLASAILWFFLRDRRTVFPFGFFLAGFSIHTLGFALRCVIAGRPPVSNMYESIIWVAWAAVFFSLLIGFFYRNWVIAASAAWVASFALLIGESFPAVLDPSLSPLVPVLRNNYWLTIHVLTITLSYGAFGLSWALGHASLISFALRPRRREEHERIDEFLYRALQIGVVLLSAGTILGGVWANSSWGRFWGWDPKETWALIALLGYLVVLHGRSSGRIGSFGTALGSVIAFLGILMAWYGVNFVLAVGLHSYGFSGGGLPYVLTAAALDLIFVSWLAFRYNKIRSRSFT